MFKDKTQIIIILGLILVIAFLLTRDEVVKTETITNIKYLPKIEEKEDTKPISIEPTIVKIPIKVPNDTIRDTIYKDVKTKKYTFKDTLPNGIVEATILSDKIYKRDIKLKTFDKHTTTKITNTIVQSNLFLGANVSTFNKTEISQASLNLYYVHKDKFIIGAGLGNDFRSKQPITNFTLAIKF